MSARKKSTAKNSVQPAQWDKERRAVRAVQVAFDLEEQVQQVIRQEALDQGVNPSDRIRQILGLEVPRRPKRLRLSISLGEADFKILADRFDLGEDDRVRIKQQASDALIEHVQGRRTGRARSRKRDAANSATENNNEGSN